jgi:hypothetical protein
MCEFRVLLRESKYSASEWIPARLEVTNRGSQTVAIAGPLFPTRWRVSRRFIQNGEVKEETTVGAILQGTTHSGVPPKYSDDEYISIGPGAMYRQEINLARYLDEGKRPPSPGDYELVFYYDHAPTASETELPLIAYPLESDPVRLTVIAK